MTFCVRGKPSGPNLGDGLGALARQRHQSLREFTLGRGRLAEIDKIHSAWDSLAQRFAFATTVATRALRWEAVPGFGGAEFFTRNIVASIERAGQTGSPCEPELPAKIIDVTLQRI